MIRIDNEKWDNVQMSGIRLIMEKVRGMKEQGIDVCSFTAGEPDFDTPSDIKEETIKALRNNRTHYCSNRGVLELREAISKVHLDRTGVYYNPESEILITTGGAEAINNAFATSIKAGDEVIIFSPAFMNYDNMVRALGAVPVRLNLKQENRFEIDLNEVKKAITEKTTHIIVNNPCNPTGVVYSEEILKELCALAIQKNITIISDEIYCNIVYEGKKFCSISQFDGMKEHCIIINGFSKGYAMTGWRLGYILAPSYFIDVCVKPHQYATTSGVTFIQEGVAKGMLTERTTEEMHAMKKEFEERSRLICKLLDNIPGLSYVKPEGAFYVMVDVEKTGLNAKSFAEKLLDEKKCAVIPATVLGPECTNLIRLSFATSRENIIKGINLIKEFVESLE